MVLLTQTVTSSFASSTLGKLIFILKESEGFCLIEGLYALLPFL